MSVKLRLRRMGKKKQPFYRVVATDSRVARDGRYIDKIGHYNPLINPPDILIDEEKALMWLQRGAIPSDTVKNILSRKGIMLKWDLIKKGIPEETIDEEVKKWELLQLEREKRKEALETQRKRDESKEVKEEDQIREEPEAAAPSEAEKKQEEAPAEVEEKKEESPEAAAPSEAEKKQEEAPAEVEEKKEESPVEAETQNEKAEETETETDVETEETRKTEEKAD